MSTSATSTPADSTSDTASRQFSRTRVNTPCTTSASWVGEQATRRTPAPRHRRHRRHRRASAATPSHSPLMCGARPGHSATRSTGWSTASAVSRRGWGSHPGVRTWCRVAATSSTSIFPRERSPTISPCAVAVPASTSRSAVAGTGTWTSTRTSPTEAETGTRRRRALPGRSTMVVRPGGRRRRRQLQTDERALGAPPFEQLDEGHGTRAVAAVLQAALTGLALVVVVAGSARLEELLVHLRQVDDRLHPCVLRLAFGLDHRHAPSACLGEDVGEVLALLVEHVWEVHRETRLDVAEDEAVGEVAAVHAVQRGCAVGPVLGERDAVTSVQLVAGPTCVVGAHLESGRVDQAVDVELLLVQLAVGAGALDHDTGRCDALHAAALGVDQFHVRPVERVEVLVVEARPFAELAVPGLECLRGVRVVDDRLHPRPDLLHLLEVGEFDRGRHALG